MRVLTVARWYPSHDSPGRGSFVADLVAATVAAGVDARVVSFDRVLIRGRVEWRDADRVPARAAFDRVATPEALFTTPRSYGAGVPVARIPVVRRPGSGDATALVEDHLDALRPFARRLVETWRPDVIHAHTGLPDGVVAATVGRELGIPVVVSEHASTVDTELTDPEARRHYRSLFEADVRVLAVSPALAERIARGVELPVDRIAILPDPVDVAAFGATAPAARDQDELLWVGSLGEHKGIDVLLRAFARVRDHRPGVRLRLVGDERAVGERDRWLALAASLGVETAITFDGWLDRAAVAAAMARASVFVHPSPSETFGVAAAEAILTGLPVATRRSGGVPWIVQLSGGYGCVAAGDDEDAFATAIETVLAGDLAVDAASARRRLIDTVGTAAVAERAMDRYRVAASDTGRAVDLSGPAAVTGAEPMSRTASSPAAMSPGALPRIVVATGRDQAIRLVEMLPVALREQVVLVLPAPVGEPGPPANAPATAFRIVEAEPVPPPKPRPRGRSPLARLRRVVHRPAPTADDVLTRAVDAARRATASREPAEIVAIDAPAAAFVARLGERRASLAPGSLRWLADRWDAGQPEGQPGMPA